MGFCWNDGKTNNWNYTIRYNKLAQTLSLLLPCLFSAMCCSVVFMSFVLFRFILTFVSLPKWTASHWSALNFQWIEASSILYISIENFPLRILHWVWHCYLFFDSIASFGWKASESKRMCWELYCSWIFSNAILLLIDFWCKNQIILKTYGMLRSLNSVLCKKSLIQDRFYSKTLCLKNR